MIETLPCYCNRFPMQTAMFSWYFLLYNPIYLHFVLCHPWEEATILFVKNLLLIFVTYFGPVLRLVSGAQNTLNSLLTEGERVGWFWISKTIVILFELIQVEESNAGYMQLQEFMCVSKLHSILSFLMCMCFQLSLLHSVLFML